MRYLLQDVKEVVGNLERENRALRARLDETVGSKSADNADVQGDDDDDGAAARESEATCYTVQHAMTSEYVI